MRWGSLAQVAALPFSHHDCSVSLQREGVEHGADHLLALSTVSGEECVCDCACVGGGFSSSTLRALYMLWEVGENES